MQPGDQTEANVDGYVVDILRGDLVIEIQTANFSAIAQKLRDLVQRRHVRLVYPVPREKWIVKLSKDGELLGRRKSPKRGSVEDVFDELVGIPELIANANFEIEVILTQEEELRQFGVRRRRRWGQEWNTVGRRLLDTTERRLITDQHDLMGLLPSDLPAKFKTSDIASSLGRKREFAQKVAYCLRNCGVIKHVAMDGNAFVYRRVRSSRRKRSR